MEKMAHDSDVSTIIARFDRSTTESILTSFATEIFRLQKVLATMQARLTALEIAAALRDSVLGATHGSTDDDFPDSVTIEASFALSAEAGFYCLEYDNEGRPYRWTGPEPLFFFELLLNRQKPRRMRLRYMRLQVPTSGRPVKCYVDGKDVESVISEKDNEFEVSVSIPPREVVGATIVMFECARVGSPSDQAQSDDKRSLGLAFRWLKIE